MHIGILHGTNLNVELCRSGHLGPGRARFTSFLQSYSTKAACSIRSKITIQLRNFCDWQQNQVASADGLPVVSRFVDALVRRWIMVLALDLGPLKISQGAYTRTIYAHAQDLHSDRISAQGSLAETTAGSPWEESFQKLARFRTTIITATEVTRMDCSEEPVTCLQGQCPKVSKSQKILVRGRLKGTYITETARALCTRIRAICIQNPWQEEGSLDNQPLKQAAKPQNHQLKGTSEIKSLSKDLRKNSQKDVARTDPLETAMLGPFTGRNVQKFRGSTRIFQGTLNCAGNLKHAQ